MKRERGYMWATRRGFLFASVGGDIYVWHIEIGRFSISWEKK